MKKLVSLIVILSLLAGLLGCAGTPAPTPAPTEPVSSLYQAGDYTASANGYGGEVEVTLTVTGDAITGVKAVGDGETPGVGSIAIDQLPGKIMDAQSAEVDGVSGATYTSDAVKAAAAECIEQATSASAGSAA